MWMCEAPHLLLGLLLLTLVLRVRPQFNLLPKRCEYLQAETQLLDLKCRGTFPMVAYTKFRDTFIMPGEPISIFMPKSPDLVMAVMKQSPLQSCSKIHFVQVNQYECIDSDGTNTTLKLTNTSMYCFPFHIQIIDDLTNACLVQNGDDDETDLLTQVLATKRGVMQYTFEMNRSTKMQSLVLLRGMFTLFALLCIRSWL
ncbi:uncharacterized protein LOC115626918 [Scaptodrosophila lebanonensis]|uniref:Uncharacterized protein LOC115626918 n=1 Tax=Drosophila lebanonensis TaxID=7225 RepID=A0A6J2TT21_DROLE|nr:uncharacterized protein LOC115626918 [Scaptodrosophila lebanonensis]